MSITDPTKPYVGSPLSPADLDRRAKVVEGLLALSKTLGSESPFVAAFIDQYGRANVGFTATSMRVHGIEIGRDAQGRPQLRLPTGGKATVTMRDDGTVAVPGLAVGQTGLTDYPADPDLFGSLDPYGRGRKHFYADGSIGISGHRIWASPRTDIAFGTVDRWGRGKIVAGLGSASGAAGYSAEEINRRDFLAIAAAEGISRTLNTSSARASAVYNLWQSYGQSLSVGGSGTPHITRTSVLDALMMGNAVHSGAATESEWAPRGTAAFNPLTGFSTTNGRGETYLEGAIAMFRRLSLDRQGVDADPSRRLVAAATGVPGETIENLSRGASQNYFNKTVTAAQVMKNIAGAASVGMPVVLFDQGQANTGGFGTTDRATWRGLVRQLRADIAQYAASAVLGQTRPPLFALFQTGGAFQRDNVALSIAMAQLDMMDDPDTILIGPTYHVTSRDDGHLTGNGYRWMGCLAGKVLFRALVLGEGWRPLSPLSATVRGDEVLITHHVPVPPLQWGLPYIGREAKDFTAKGYRVFDASGDCGISGAEIVGQATVRLKLGRASVGATTLRYAGQATFTGHGCLRDSDRTRAALTYDFYSDLDADENISDLVGNPYPMNNWCVGYQMPLTRD